MENVLLWIREILKKLPKPILTTLVVLVSKFVGAVIYK